MRDRPGETADHCDSRKSAQRNRDAISADEFGGTISQRIGPRTHRLMAEMAPNVVSERRDGSVALLRIFLECLGDDVFEIAFQLMPEPFRRRRTPPRVVAKRFDGERLRGSDRVGKPRRVGVDDRFDQSRRRPPAIADGMLAGQEDVEQHTQRINVGRRRHRIAEQLFRGGKFGRESTTGVAGQLAHVAERGFVLQQLRDAEIQQLNGAAVADQHIRRLDVSVDDEIGVSVGDGGQHVDEQTKTCSDAEPIDIAITVDPLAFDVLDHQIRLSGGRDAGVDQARDVRMGKPSKNAALALKTFLACASDQCGVQQLDGDFALETAVAAPSEPHGPHAALAERRFQCVGADRLTDQR